MSNTFTRRELHELVWSEPMLSLARKLSLSDRGLAKVCAAANVPVPARGYWAKLQAGKAVTRAALPPRGLGQQDRVRIDRHGWAHEPESDAEILREPIPPLPIFEPDMEAVRAQAVTLVRRAPLPLRGNYGWHPQIAKLLAADEERVRKQRASPYPLSWDDPIFNNPFEQRRLRILNALFICLTRCGMRASVSGKHGREVFVKVADTAVPLSLDATGAAKLLERERSGYSFVTRGNKDTMRLALSRWWGAEPNVQCWEDKKGDRLERHLRDIAAAIIVFAEQHVRDSAARLHGWRIERKAKLEEAERKRLAEEERRRQERQAQREKARVDHLLSQARAFRQAEQIRAYVSGVRAINATAPDGLPPTELNAWSSWALVQADRIDPVLSGAYKTRPAESDE